MKSLKTDGPGATGVAEDLIELDFDQLACIAGGKAQVSDFTFTKKIDASSPTLQ